ncbi:MAG: hypothetical protein ACOCXQ_01305 [Patescibacteria group bacterium]
MTNEEGTIHNVSSEEAVGAIIHQWDISIKENKNLVLGIPSDTQMKVFFREFCNTLQLVDNAKESSLSTLFTVSIDGFLYPSHESSHRRSRFLRSNLWQCLHGISHSFDYHRQGFVLDSHLEEPEETIFFEEAVEEIGGFSAIILPEATVNSLPFKGVLAHFLENVPIYAINDCKVI